MKRIATITKLLPGMREAYQRLHENIWTEVVKVGHQANQRNFTIFAYQDYLFSYFEYIGDDYSADMAFKKAQPIIQKWAKETGSYTDYVLDNTKIIELDELWHEDF